MSKLFRILFLAIFVFRFTNSIGPTQSYLMVPELKNLVQSYWGNELNKYKEIVEQIKNRECLCDSGYHVFYHAQSSKLRIIYDVLKELYSFLYPEVKIKDFYFLRPWYELPQTVSANSFIDEYEQGHPQYWCDNNPHFIKRMLSVNLSLFGSTKNYGVFGECSFKYFFANKSIKAPDIELMLKNIFSHFGIRRKYLYQVLDLNKLIETDEGTIFQIFIPNNNVDQITFLAQRLGTPYRQSIINDIFDHSKKRHLSITPILNIYRTSPYEILSVIDRLQARLIFSQDVLLNPCSGVKIFRYTTILESALKKYNLQLKKLMHDILKKWLTKVIKNKKLVLYPIDQSLLDKLAIYYNIH